MLGESQAKWPLFQGEPDRTLWGRHRGEAPTRLYRAGLVLVAAVLLVVAGACGGAETAAPVVSPTVTLEPAVTPTLVPEADPTATSEPESPKGGYTIADLAGDAGLTQLADTAGEVGLGDALADPDAGPFTVFAPTNDAFAEAGATLDGMDADQVGRTLRFHIAEGEFLAGDLPAGTGLTTLDGELVIIDDRTVNGVAIASVAGWRCRGRVAG